MVKAPPSPASAQEALSAGRQGDILHVVPLRMSSSAVTTMTLEEWAALDEDEPGELVDGRLVEEEMPDAVHEVIVVWFTAMIRTWLAPRGGFVLGSEAKYAVAITRG